MRVGQTVGAALDRVMIDALFASLKATGAAEIPHLGRLVVTDQGIEFLAEASLCLPEPTFENHQQPTARQQLAEMLGQMLASAVESQDTALRFDERQALRKTALGWQTLATYDQLFGRELLALLQHPAFQERLREELPIERLLVWPEHRPVSATVIFEQKNTAHRLAPLAQVAWQRIEGELHPALFVVSGPDGAARQTVSDRLRRHFIGQGFQAHQLSVEEPAEVQLIQAHDHLHSFFSLEGPLEASVLRIAGYLAAGGSPIVLSVPRLDPDHLKRVWRQMHLPQRVREVGVTTLPTRSAEETCTACQQPDHLVSRRLLDSIHHLPSELAEQFSMKAPKLVRNSGCEQCSVQPKQFVCFELKPLSGSVTAHPSLETQHLSAVCHGQATSTSWR